ncbi:hypothetical protein JJJ17_18580 [Paracoccus caeni]|uniref:Uncharacterized protein n=1 Tax=Paracoccus caeni TaxID=657651 RepID=A0A934SMR3_9RHOB|nr:hypothetical protein [Paracoccus caeni]MBK4217939.1 hypothetical protein [Paracoccus caeni]
MNRRYLTAAGIAAIAVIGAGSYALTGGGTISKSQMRLVDRFTTSFLACADIDPGGRHLSACNDARQYKAQLDQQGLCIDYGGSRESYEGFYRCGER